MTPQFLVHFAISVYCSLLCCDRLEEGIRKRIIFREGLRDSTPHPRTHTHKTDIMKTKTEEELQLEA
jgi:hypothetical protein